MFRIIIAVLLIYLVVKMWKKASMRRTHAAPKPTSISASEMIACDRCGTFILADEAIANGDSHYCSEGCRSGN